MESVEKVTKKLEATKKDYKGSSPEKSPFKACLQFAKFCLENGCDTVLAKASLDDGLQIVSGLLFHVV
jgi:hypothetical protein